MRPTRPPCPLQRRRCVLVLAERARAWTGHDSHMFGATKHLAVGQDFVGMAGSMCDGIATVLADRTCSLPQPRARAGVSGKTAECICTWDFK